MAKPTLRGTSEFVAKTGALSLHAKLGLQKLLKMVSFEIEGNTRVNAPVKTGNLKGSYQTDIDLKKIEAIIGTEVEYAPFVEFSTEHQKAQPHFRPALNKFTPVWFDGAAEVLRSFK